MAPTILCLASYFKGGAFLEECKRLGCHTILITSQDLEHEAWPRASIDEFFVMPFANLFKQPDITNAVSYLARNRKIDRIIADHGPAFPRAVLLEHRDDAACASVTAFSARPPLVVTEIGQRNGPHAEVRKGWWCCTRGAACRPARRTTSAATPACCRWALTRPG